MIRTWPKKNPQRLWRAHSDAVNAALLLSWLPTGQVEHLLKTDLLDEAVSNGLYPLLTLRAKRVTCSDLSFEVIQMAKSRHAGLMMIETDVRCLPFPDNTFDVIVSNSTLDHFESSDDLVTSLRELYRVLRPGGQMILTLDNPANLIIFLRNKLPFHLVYRLGIVPYYVGATLGPNRLQQVLKKIGFEVIEVDAIMHCPRVFAVAIARWMEKHTRPKAQRGFLRFLMAFECLSHWPTRFITGHFVAVKVIKRQTENV